MEKLVESLYFVSQSMPDGRKRIRGVFEDLSDAKRIAESALAVSFASDQMDILEAPKNTPIDDAWIIWNVTYRGGYFKWLELSE